MPATPCLLKTIKIALGTIITVAMLIFMHDANQERGPLGIIAVGMLALLLLYFVSSKVFRVVVRQPAIIVNDEGIVDNWSLGYRGVGLVRWHEIRMLSHYVRQVTGPSQHFFVIFPDKLVLARRSRWQRFVSGSIRFSAPGTITISCMALPLSPHELLAEIERRFARQLHTHHISIVGPRKPAS